MLLRTRPAASGRHFGLHLANVSDDLAGLRGRLIVAAPKRVLKRAVERNAMRRVAREAWRAAGLDRRPVVGLLRVRAAFEPAAAEAGLPARKRLARAELDQLFLAAQATLRRRECAR
ncbi:MAG: ribonuclease P protein component [Burkholderiaceae bacterium]|nr:ribonuclease P protein component [Burkholderiaceae bacterium]